MPISEYVCKTCLKELEILLKCRKTFEKLLATLLKILVFHNFFSKVSENCILRTPRSAFMLSFFNSKLTKMTGKDKQHHIFQKSKSYAIYSTVILVRTGNLWFMYLWFIPLDHETYTKCKKKHLTWLKAYLGITSALELKVNK